MVFHEVSETKNFVSKVYFARNIRTWRYNSFLQTAHGINMGLPQVLLTSTTNELVFNDLFSLREVSQVSFFLCIGFELEMQIFKDSIIYQLGFLYLDSGLR